MVVKFGYKSYYLKTGKLNKRWVNTYNKPLEKSNNLHPSYISGFFDGEGSFIILVLKRETYKYGWNIVPVFTINLGGRDTTLLKRIQSYFGVGKISIRKKDGSVYFTVNSVKDLVNVIIPHFDKYPLLTEKQADYEIFKQIVIIMYNKQHLSTEGLNKVISLKASLNKGLTPFVTKHFPNVNPMERPVIKSYLKDPYWAAGFVEAEGCFHIAIIKSKTYKTGYQIQLNFNIVQHSRDKILIESLVSYFNCGGVYENTGHVTFVVTKLSDISDKIIPFFQKYSLQGFKLYDFDKFSRVAKLMQEKAHLNSDGINEILKIKNG